MRLTQFHGSNSLFSRCTNYTCVLDTFPQLSTCTRPGHVIVRVSSGVCCGAVSSPTCVPGLSRLWQLYCPLPKIWWAESGLGLLMVLHPVLSSILYFLRAVDSQVASITKFSMSISVVNFIMNVTLHELHNLAYTNHCFLSLTSSSFRCDFPVHSIPLSIHSLSDCPTVSSSSFLGPVCVACCEKQGWRKLFFAVMIWVSSLSESGYEHLRTVHSSCSWITP